MANAPHVKAGPRAATGLGWPDEMDNGLATLLVDAHMIEYLGRQPAQAVRMFQFKAIGRLLGHARKHSGWWREHLAQLDTKAPLNFSDLPLMSRPVFREALAGGALPLPLGHGQISSAATSGSTGIPLTFYSSGIMGRLNRAQYWQDRIRQGIDSTRRIARFSVHLPEHASEHVASGPNPLMGRGEELQRRPQQFSVEQHARWLSDIEPAYVVSHPTVLSGIMDVFEEGKLAPPRIDALLTFAESLRPEFRARAKAIFGARTVDRYSSQEVGPIAFQCPKSDKYYHVANSHVVVEVLDDGGKLVPQGQLGRVHVSSLHNYASPTIRYELGDLAALLPRCPCGHDQPVLTNILGRERFLIRLPGGERVYVNFGARHWFKIAPVSEHRLVQTEPLRIEAEYVMDRPMTETEERALVGLLQTEISPQIEYVIRRRDRIDWGPTYKRQDVVSLI